jgi:oxygen-independent coproporphyrinogen-3 oxidase
VSNDEGSVVLNHFDVPNLMRPGTLQLQSLPPLSLYIHLPWCIKKCPYCDFNSHEQKGNELSAKEQQTYIDALLSDLDQSLGLIWGRKVQSIFIGGGTPSLFNPEAIDTLLSQIRARLPLVADCEITLEANPGTFEKDRFKSFKLAGVNRLSIGVQSFNDSNLKSLGRVHNAQQAIEAVQEASVNFETFNIDLMYALPEQDLKALALDLKQALSFTPPHLSIYHLTLEANTYFAKYPPENLPSDDSAYEMLDLITEMTQAVGLDRYEVSAFSKKNHRCFHNLNYWGFGDYLGIGAGAHSKLSFPHRVIRQIRVRDPQLYIEKALVHACVAKHEEVSRKNLPFEFMLGALRLKNGFELKTYTERTGLPISSIHQALETAQAKSLVVLEGDHLQPTTLGFDFLNDLQSLFL